MKVAELAASRSRPSSQRILTDCASSALVCSKDLPVGCRSRTDCASSAELACLRGRHATPDSVSESAIVSPRHELVCRQCEGRHPRHEADTPLPPRHATPDSVRGPSGPRIREGASPSPLLQGLVRGPRGASVSPRHGVKAPPNPRYLVSMLASVSTPRQTVSEVPAEAPPSSFSFAAPSNFTAVAGRAAVAVNKVRRACWWGAGQVRRRRLGPRGSAQVLRGKGAAREGREPGT